MAKKEAFKSWLFISSLSSVFIKLNIYKTRIVHVRVCRLSHSHVEIGEVMNRIKTHRRQQHDIIIKCYFEFFRFTQTIFDEYHSMLLSIGLRVVQSPRATSLELLRVCFLFASPFFGRFVRFGYNVLMPFFLHIVLLRLVCIAFKTKRLQYLPGIGTEEKRCWRYSLSHSHHLPGYTKVVPSPPT